jgi:hypothetical protein
VTPRLGEMSDLQAAQLRLEASGVTRSHPLDHEHPTALGGAQYLAQRTEPGVIDMWFSGNGRR